MKKRTKKKIIKKIKKFFTIILLIGLLLIGTFFIDKKTFNKLTTNIISEINKITKKIEQKINKYKKAQYDEIDLNNDLMVFFLDVGQAESILIKSNDQYMLIDAGNTNDGEKIVNYFNHLRINEFKYVFGTHAHEDHIGGMDEIIKEFKIDNFYMPKDITTTETYISLLNALEDKKVAYKTPSVGTRLELGKASIDVLSVKTKQNDLNDTSIVLKLTYNNISFLFTGDITQNVEKELVNKNIKSTVLKVAHHGSKYSNSAAFLNKVKPEYSIISCGINNEYYHPHKVVLDKLEKLNSKIYRTDLDGTIVAISNGEKIEFKTIKTYTDGG